MRPVVPALASILLLLAGGVRAQHPPPAPPPPPPPLASPDIPPDRGDVSVPRGAGGVVITPPPPPSKDETKPVITMPRPLNYEPPEFPKEAQDAGIEASVTLRLDIDRQG